MKRKFFDSLKAWKLRGGRFAMLIDSAHRVGKSYIAEQFAREEYKSHIIIDFDRRDKNVEELFENHLGDMDTF